LKQQAKSAFFTKNYINFINSEDFFEEVILGSVCFYY